MGMGDHVLSLRKPFILKEGTMKKTGMALFVIFFVLGALGTAGAASFEMPLNPKGDPEGTDVHMSVLLACFIERDPWPVFHDKV